MTNFQQKKNIVLISLKSWQKPSVKLISELINTILNYSKSGDV